MPRPHQRYQTQQLDWTEGEWIVEPLSPELRDIRRRAARAAVEDRAKHAFLNGFVPAHPAFDGQRLQVRNNEDRTNWLTSQNAAGQMGCSLTTNRTDDMADTPS